ncbi:MAG: hypothetical protein A2Y62_06440 [Candidatus Fischerbacteria bacterium RBG_13_37_8]|uniref:Uncharacterized protein n=1 Tax=Candidatus Fischerbacteria bacterium RBG_13_37_8 TaxID=1817863 RepID=A0A1F5VR13_9BACT|nr:MAG: hypothetical protein A2Y62_06440 [Candidatus Fischerbacteria bacterium RBG_13_37_8]
MENNTFILLLINLFKLIRRYKDAFIIGVKMFFKSMHNIKQKNELENILKDFDKVLFYSINTFHITKILIPLIEKADDSRKMLINSKMDLILKHYSSLKDIVDSKLYDISVVKIILENIFIDIEFLFKNCYEAKPWNRSNWNTLKDMENVDNFIEIYNSNKAKLKSFWKCYFKEANKFSSSSFVNELNVWIHSNSNS